MTCIQINSISLMICTCGGSLRVSFENPMKLSLKVTRPGPVMTMVVMCLLIFFGTGTPCLAQGDGLMEPIPKSAPPLAVDSAWVNDRILAAIEKMPIGGGYAVTSSASKALGSAIGLDESGNLSIKAAMAKPSFCSGAVYLVMLIALKPEIDGIKDPEVRRTLIRTLDVTGQPDGKGIWGRWNSNGPCMAVTFAESGLGRSFWGYKSAAPGDFLKLWWTEAIGRDESGHSVVFLGFKKAENGEDGIEIWSANKPEGYGKKVIPLSKIKHAQVSRFEHPNKVVGLLRLSEKNDYLASMLKRTTTPDEIDKRITLTGPACP